MSDVTFMLTRDFHQMLPVIPQSTMRMLNDNTWKQNRPIWLAIQIYSEYVIGNKHAGSTEMKLMKHLGRFVTSNASCFPRCHIILQILLLLFILY